MPRFRVIITASEMSIPPENCFGFATTRFVRADSEQEAGKLALDIVAADAHAEPAFANSPKPNLAVHLVSRVWSPFKLSRPNKGYCFYGPDSTLQDALDIESQVGTGWFL